MALHQTLKNLCFRSGWCYAVFWKLKRRSRMVLTWEDGYYECQLSDFGGNMSCLESGGNPLVQGGARHDASYCEGQIGLAVAKMSYCVYFMGEGIIGRVAFTGKHQWVFGNGEMNGQGIASGNAMNSQCMLEKYPSSWEVQFAAGIKTIAVISVPQGVVQLGSTQMITENLEWVDRVKSAFGTLHGVPGAITSDLAPEGQGGKAAISPPGMHSGSLSTRLGKSAQSQFSSRGVGDVQITGLQSLVYGFDGRSSAFNQSNSQKPSAVVEPAEPLQILPQKAEMLQGSTSLRPLVINSSSQIFGTLSAAPEVAFGSALTQQISLPCEDTRNYDCGDFRSPQLRNNHVQCSSMDAFSRARGLDADADVSMHLNEQSNTTGMPAFSGILDPKSHMALASTSDRNPKGAPPALVAPLGFGIDVTASNLNGMVGNMGGFAAGNQDSLSSFGGKSYGDQGFSVDSMIGGTLQITHPDNECFKPCSKDTVSFSKGVASENLVSGGMNNFETYLASVAQGQSSKWDCPFGIGDELSEALGPAFRQSNDTWEKGLKPVGMEQNKVAVEQHTSGGTCALSDISAVELVPTWGSSFVVKNESHFLESKEEPLLDAIVASASSSHPSISTAVDDSFSCRTFSVKDNETSVSKITQGPPLKHVRGHSSQDFMSQSFVHTGPADCEASVNNEALSKAFKDPLSFNSSSPLKTILSSWTEDMQSMRSADSTQTSQSKKPEDLTKATRKRARPGESARPRPKDRQQIQDRVRELREIVPNGSKCSIDALLEKTIKHMLFLQNVTLHADNLKKNGELKDDVESGESWALELGGKETSRPPVLVKNLNQPRQLLVEMFCEEKGHFLEIADIIRSLGLTILKGVMESRSDKIWARFVVEANRDVRRVDIMMSLVHLLHVNKNSSSSMTMASQTAPIRSQPGVDSSSSSQTQTLCGFQQSSLHA
eukprot:c10417_g1_i1 orf=432-3260(-)